MALDPPYRLIAIGASLGGPAALCSVLSRLPACFPVAIAVVQHRGKSGDDPICRILQQACALEVVEAVDKAPLAPGRVTVAPPDYHLLIEGDSCALSVDRETKIPHACRKDVELLPGQLVARALMEWIAEVLVSRSLAVPESSAGQGGKP